MPSNAEAKTLLLQHLPPGAVRWMRLDAATNAAGSMWSAIAQAVKLYGFDVLDTLRRELKARQMVERIPDWERLLRIAIDTTRSNDQRRAEIIARRRETGASSVPDIYGRLRAVTGPTALTIVERDRSDLRLAHTYAFPGVPLSIPGNADLDVTVSIGDNAPAGEMGAQVRLTLTTAHLEDLTFRLTAPDASFATWPALGTGTVTGARYWLFAPSLAGVDITGDWVFTVGNGNAATSTLDTDGSPGDGIFVEGIGIHSVTGAQGLGAAQLEWIALMEEAAADGAYSRDVAQYLVRRSNPAHTTGYLCLTGVGDGVTADAGIWGSPTNSMFDGCIWE